MPEPRIVASTLRFRNALLSKEAQASTRLVSAYGRIYQNLNDKIRALEADIMELGEDATPNKVIKLTRFKALLNQTADEMDKYAVILDNEVATLRQQAIADALAHNKTLVQQALPNLPRSVQAQLLANFNYMPATAVEAMLGALSADSPLNKLLQDYGKAAALDIGNTITDGLALGYNPRKVAAQIQKSMGGNLTRALLISRTETLRAYRAATLSNYAANSDIVKGWVWTAAKSTRSCLACLALDGKEFPLSEQFQKSHPNCRCSPRPKTIGYEALGLKVSTPLPQYDTGAQWFNKLSDADKQGMMSKEAFEAYKSGRVSLTDFIGERQSKQWGSSYYEKPISDIIKVANVGGVGTMELQSLIDRPDEFIQFIEQQVGENFSGSIGLRGLYKEEGIGKLRPSRVWSDGDPTDEILDGTSAVLISGDYASDPASVIREYIRKYGDHVFRYGNSGKIGLVIGDSAYGGEDPGEIIIQNARVIYTWKKKKR